jgi:hypothetical protein
MHWSGKMVGDQSGNGLGAWLKWLRGKARTTRLHEAREMLAASIGSAPPGPAKNLVRQAKCAGAVAKKKKKPSRAPILLIASVITLAAVGAGGWELKRRYQIMQDLNPSEELTTDSAIPEIARISTRTPTDEPSSQPAAGETPAEKVTRKASEMLAESQDLQRKKEARRAEIIARGNLFEVADRELLLEKKNSEVQLEGRLAEVRFSSGKGTILYLEFSESTAQNEPRGYIKRDDLTGETTLEAIRKFIGKGVRLRGKVTTPSSRNRPEIEIKNLDAIQIVK